MTAKLSFSGNSCADPMRLKQVGVDENGSKFTLIQIAVKFSLNCHRKLMDWVKEWYNLLVDGWKQEL